MQNAVPADRTSRQLRRARQSAGVRSPPSVPRVSTARAIAARADAPKAALYVHSAARPPMNGANAWPAAWNDA